MRLCLIEVNTVIYLPNLNVTNEPNCKKNSAYKLFIWPFKT